MAGMFSALSGMFPSGKGYHNYNDEQNNVYYAAQLREYLANEEEKRRQAAIADERAYNERWSGDFGQTVDKLLQGTPEAPGLLSRPGLNDEARTALTMMGAAASRGNPLTLKGVVDMFENSQNAFTRGQIPSENMREYQLAKQDPGYEQFVMQSRQGQIPSRLQEFDRLRQLQRAGDPGADTLEQIINPRNPGQAADLETAKKTAQGESEYTVKTMSEFPKIALGYKSIIDDASRVGSLLDNAISSIQSNPSAVGLGSIFNFVPESDAKSIAAQLDTLRSNISLEKLMQLKAVSPTGASGFGALSEGELAVIQNFVGKLDPSLKPEDLVASLVEVRRVLNKAKDSAMLSWEQDANWIENNKARSGLLYERSQPSIEMFKQLRSSSPQTAPPSASVTDTFEKNKQSVTGSSPAPGSPEWARQELARRRGGR